MKSFEVEGVSYRSISEFCRKRKVSYWKMVRLCRKYVRAQKDPALAARWVLKIERCEYGKEPKTFLYVKEKTLGKYRQSFFRQNKKNKLAKSVMCQIMKK